MSHFCVLVIGDDYEKQLAPYHEFECTGVDDEYVREVDITDKVLEEVDDEESLAGALEDHGLEAIAPGEKPDLQNKHKYGYAIVDNGKLIRAIDRTNPNAKWDYYQVGGRWSGLLKLKPGSYGELGSRGLMGSCANAGADRADITTKGSVDLDGMREEARAEASNEWEKARGGGLTWRPWDEIREENTGDIGSARLIYREQPEMLAASDATGRFDVDDFLVDKSEYVQRAIDSAGVTFAVVKDGKWFERGEMGWWCIVRNEKCRDEWNRNFSALLDELPPETKLTVIDCHI